MFVPEELRQRIIRETRDHTKKSTFSSFYSISYNAFILLAQVVYQASYALSTLDVQFIAILQHQVQFVYLLFCVYYGVEHYMITLPNKIEEVPGKALRLCFTRALNKLGERIAGYHEDLKPFHQRKFAIPTGANVIEVKYHAEDDIDAHIGCPYDKKKSYTLSVEVTVHTFEMLPVASSNTRESYIQSRLGNTPFADVLVFPERKITEPLISC